jgi:hypothetical protein
MKNYIPGACRMEGWLGSRSNVDMLMERKIPVCGKTKALECQSILLAELHRLKNRMIIADVWKLLWPSVIKKCKPMAIKKSNTRDLYVFVTVQKVSVSVIKHTRAVLFKHVNGISDLKKNMFENW